MTVEDVETVETHLWLDDAVAIGVGRPRAVLVLALLLPSVLVPAG